MIINQNFKPKFTVIFYKELSGRKPVIEWLKKLDRDEQEAVAEDLETLQMRWPLGMPLIGTLGSGFWELRSRFKTRIGRIIFVVIEDTLILLHAFIKKTQKTPPRDLAIAKKRYRAIKDGNKYGYA